jgi:hypothetical protein
MPHRRILSKPKKTTGNFALGSLGRFAGAAPFAAAGLIRFNLAVFAFSVDRS